jgi:hypothetical protein
MFAGGIVGFQEYKVMISGNANDGDRVGVIPGRRMSIPALVAMLVIAAHAIPIHAQTFTWTGLGGDANWTNNANWDTGTAPSATANTNVFINFGTIELTATFRDVGRNGVGSQTMSGGSLTINGGQRFGVLTAGSGNGTGTQSGGSIVSTGLFQLGTQVDTLGTYFLSGNGYLEASHFSIGGSGTGVFHQSGGTFAANGPSGSFIGQGSSNSAANGTYNLSGGLLTRNSTAGISLAPGANAVGVLNQTGGAINLAGGGGLSVGALGSGTYSIQDGSINAGSLVVAGTNAVSGSVNVGPNAVMDFTGGLALGATGQINFLFDTTGVSMMSFGGAGAIDPAGVIRVDGSAYTGGPGIFALIDALSFDNTPTVDLSGFPSGTTYDWDLANGNFIVTTVPEPASGVLVGLGMLALMLRLRRQVLG